MSRMFTVDKILNDVAVECGLTPSSQPWETTDPAFVQLRYLLNGAGQELLELYPWQVLRREHTIITDSVTYPDQSYPLPTDFGYMIDQTGWDRSSNLPLQGPTTPQQWTYLEGRNLASSTVYASFQLDQNNIQLFPSGIADGKEITFRYISRHWAEKGSSPSITGLYELDAANNRVRYEPILIKRLLKVKFQAAKGFDNSNAIQEFIRAMDSWTGKSKGAQILNASGGWRRHTLLNAYRNAPDTGYGTI